MERKKLLEEYKVTLESLVEKNKFVYSEKFYELSDLDKQKYQKDKMATEAHLSTLCELLWGNNVTFDGGLGSMFALGLMSSMFNYGGGFGSSSSTDYIKQELEKTPLVEEPQKKPSKRTKRN